MGMSTHVIGFRPPNEQWKAMARAYEGCRAAGVPIPPEVDEFFDGEPPDDNGAEVEIGSALRPWQDESRQGYEVDVTKLPKDLTVLRFYNSW